MPPIETTIICVLFGIVLLGTTAVFWALIQIMSKISEYAAAVNAKFDRIETAQGVLSAAVTGLTGDIQFLKDKIEELQNSPGEISPEDQALLDALQARSELGASRLEGVADALKGLDEATTVPTPPAPTP